MLSIPNSESKRAKSFPTSLKQYQQQLKAKSFSQNKHGTTEKKAKKLCNCGLPYFISTAIIRNRNVHKQIRLIIREKRQSRNPTEERQLPLFSAHNSNDLIASQVLQCMISDLNQIKCEMSFVLKSLSNLKYAR